MGSSDAVKIAATLLINELLPRLKKRGMTVNTSPVSPQELAGLSLMKARGLITTREIRRLLDDAFDTAGKA